MKFVLIRMLVASCAMAGVIAAQAQNVIEDDEAVISLEEMQATIDRWPQDMRKAAANSLESREELAKLSLAAKKVAQSAEDVTPESDPEFYWDLKLQVQMLVRRLMVQNYLDNIELPDLEPLAREHYEAEKDSLAKVSERRMSSHILFLCTPQKCEYEDVPGLAAQVLAELRGGADFAELVEKYSDDNGTKKKGGKFRWVRLGEPRVSPEYTEGVFSIENVGDYSDVVSSKFGLHIIRLDEVEPAYYKPFEEVKDKVLAAIETKYRQLAAMEFDRQYAPTENFTIDEAALEAMLAPYRTEGVGVNAENAQTEGENQAGSE